MITLANGNVYTFAQFTLGAKGAVTGYYSVANQAAQALGFPESTVTLDLQSMPEMVTFFSNPETNQLPSLQSMENWIVSSHASDGQTALDLFTGGIVS